MAGRGAGHRGLDRWKVLPVLQGSVIYHLDDKGRFRLPADYAGVLGPTFAITRAPDRCLWLLPEDTWLGFVEKLNSGSLFNASLNALQRYFLGSGTTTSLDAHGRLTIPPLLRDLAGIKQDVQLVGTGKRVELWNPESYNSYLDDLSPEAIRELARDAGFE